MKKILLSLILIASIVASCERDYGKKRIVEELVDVELQVTTPSIEASRGEASGLDSALGAIDNFNNNSELWELYDLRYILEIYEVIKEGSDATISESPIYKRQMLTTDNYDAESVSFKMQVVPNRTYIFVVWADFVEEGEAEDLYYDTTDLRTISRKASYAHKAMEEALDAYHICATETIKSAANINLTLTRPMAKLRVVAIDYDEISNYAQPTSVSVKFDTENNPVYKSFNAVTSEIFDNCPAHEYAYSIDPMPYQEYSGTTATGESLTGVVLFSDYIFTPRDIATLEKNEYPVSFSMTIFYDNSEEINRVIDFDTQIPLSRNYLTTLVGNCLTQKENFIIEINDTLLMGEEITN